MLLATHQNSQSESHPVPTLHLVPGRSDLPAGGSGQGVYKVPLRVKVKGHASIQTAPEDWGDLDIPVAFFTAFCNH